MSYAEAHTITVTTDASGNATEYSPVVTGRIMTIIYTKPGSGGFDTGVDFSITTEDTGQDVWVEDNVDASKTISPRQPTHDKAGTASLYAGSGEPVEDYIIAASERIKVTISNGGDTKTGTFVIIIA